MVEVLRFDQQASAADLRLRSGCPICGGDAVVRATKASAWTHCDMCRRFYSSGLVFTPVGLQLVVPITAHA